MVVNLDLPKHMEQYLHRIGRTGRYGRQGIGLSLVTDEQKETLKNLECFYDIVIEQTFDDFKNINFDF